MLTISTALNIHSIVRHIPLRDILLETDSPHFVPRNVNQQYNFSNLGNALNIAMRLAQLQNTSVNNVITTSSQNVRAVYNI